MNVILLLEDEQSIDITEYLDDEMDLELGQQLERRAFQRTVDDIRLKCSNLGGEFSEWLSPTTATSRMPGNGSRIVIKDEGRILFRGEIERPINFDVNDEWVSLDCFSMTKQLFDLAKATKVSKAVPTGQEELLFTTVQELIQREVSMERFGHLTAGYQISDLYALRRIRFWGYTADPTVGNNGRYKDLDPRTTVDELLKAMTVYYNADIFIDPETELLVMQKRNGILNDLNHALDDQLIEEDEIDVQLYDQGQIDYLGLTLNFATPSAPEATRTGGAAIGMGLGPGRYKWAVTFLYRSGSFNLESALGDESDSIDLPPMRTPGSYTVYLNIPLGPGGCVGRRIYRTKNGGIGSFYLAATVDNNSDTVFADATPQSSLQISARKSAMSGTIWLRYDESSGLWDAVIIGDASGLNVPIGEIFDVTPHLRFLAKPFGYGQEIAAIYPFSYGRTRVRTKGENGFEKLLGVRISQTNCALPLDGDFTVEEVFDDKMTFSVNDSRVTSPGTGGTVIRISDVDKEPPIDTASEMLIDVFAFFGNEKDRLSDLQEQWRDLFLTKKRVVASVKGLGYRVGDSASLSRTYNGHTIGRCVIKKATNNLMKETTKLELLTI